MKNLKVLWVVVLVLGLASSAKAQLQFSTTNLVTDNQAVNVATITDSSSVNSWGISYSPSSPFWVSAGGSGTGVANVYTITASNGVTKSGTMPTIPGTGFVTGQASNSATPTQFQGAKFLFVNLDGTISGWTSGGSASIVLQAASTANVYTGAAEATINGNSYLYEANFFANAVNVTAGTATAPTLTGTFTDPNLPATYAPYNIVLSGTDLFVSYAVQNGAKNAAVKATGNGLVDEFDTQGNFIARIASNGSLNAPWGMAIAPTSFGSYAGDLLVGNFGGGAINAYNLGTDTFVGQLPGTSGPLTIPGLWALIPGNGVSAGSTQDIYFTAGPNNQADGLVGVIAPVPEPSTLALLGVGTLGLLAFRWRRRKAAG